MKHNIQSNVQGLSTLHEEWVKYMILKIVFENRIFEKLLILARAIIKYDIRDSCFVVRSIPNSGNLPSVDEHAVLPIMLISTTPKNVDINDLKYIKTYGIKTNT